MENLLNLSKGERKVETYNLLSASKIGRSENLVLYLTNKKLVAVKKSSSILKTGNDITSININDIVGINTAIHKQLKIGLPLLFLIFSIIYTIIVLIGKDFSYIGVVITLDLVLAVWLVLAIIFPRGYAELNIMTAPISTPLMITSNTIIGRKRGKEKTLNLQNVIINSDFRRLSKELPALIDNLQDANNVEENYQPHYFNESDNHSDEQLNKVNNDNSDTFSIDDIPEL